MRYIATIIFSALAFGALAAESADTVIAVSGAKSVTIIDTPGRQVKVEICKGADTLRVDYPYPADGRILKSQSPGDTIAAAECAATSCKNYTGWCTDFLISDIDMGFLTATGTPEGLDIDPAHSFEIGALNLAGERFSSPISRGWRSHFSVGLGVDWRIYSLKRGEAWSVDGDGNVGIEGYPEGTYALKSRLNTFTLQLPVLYTLELPCRWWGGHPSITVGAIGCWNTSVTATTRWETPEHNELSRHDAALHQRRFTVDFTARLRLCPFLSIYARYSPVSVFAPSRGPEIHPLSFGISLF